MVDVGRSLRDLVRSCARTPQRAEGGPDDHERVADLVRDHRREASEGGEALAQRRLALEAGNRLGQGVEGVGEQPRVLVVPGTTGRDLAREVAGRGELL